MIEGSYPSTWRTAAAILSSESLDAIYIKNGQVFEFEMKLTPRPVAPLKMPPLFVQLPTIGLRWDNRKGKLVDV
jgi:hypothetical protein